jgi:hypothetical protein
MSSSSSNQRRLAQVAGTDEQMSAGTEAAAESVDVVVEAGDHIGQDPTALWAVGRLSAILTAAGLRVGTPGDSGAASGS